MLGVEVSNRKCEVELGYDVVKKEINILCRYKRVLF